MTKRNTTVLFLGSNGFPFGMAAIQRQIQLAKSIQNGGVDVVVLNWKGVHNRSRIQSEHIQTSGMFQGIKYYYTSGNPAYPQNFFVRNILKIIGRAGELFLILFYRFTKDVRFLMVNSLRIGELRYYHWIARLIGIKVIYDYVEFVSALNDREKQNDLKTDSFDYQFIKYAEKIICISPFLEDHLRVVAPKKKFLLIPPIVDFEQVSRSVIRGNQKRYFLFCGSAGYHDIYKFVIEAFDLGGFQNEGIELVLIINGEHSQVEKIREMVRDHRGIRMLSGLNYDELLGYYKGALGLLIPMSDNLQDRARFPFKICEYTASGRPIITTAGGPITHYFTHEINAIISLNGDIQQFATGMRFIATHPEKATEIGHSGFILGMKLFNFRTYSGALAELVTL